MNGGRRKEQEMQLLLTGRGGRYRLTRFVKGFCIVREDGAGH